MDEVKVGDRAYRIQLVSVEEILGDDVIYKTVDDDVLFAPSKDSWLIHTGTYQDGYMASLVATNEGIVRGAGLGVGKTFYDALYNFVRGLSTLVSVKEKIQ